MLTAHCPLGPTQTVHFTQRTQTHSAQMQFSRNQWHIFDASNRTAAKNTLIVYCLPQRSIRDFVFFRGFIRNSTTQLEHFLKFYLIHPFGAHCNLKISREREKERNNTRTIVWNVYLLTKFCGFPIVAFGGIYWMPICYTPFRSFVHFVCSFWLRLLG